jgi:hypothetical protein
MIFKKRKIEKLKTSQEDEIAFLKAEHNELKRKFITHSAVELDKLEKEQKAKLKEKEESSKKDIQKLSIINAERLEEEKSTYRKKLHDWKIKADLHLQRETDKYKVSLEREQKKKTESKKLELDKEMKLEISIMLDKFEQKKKEELTRLEQKYKDIYVLKRQLQHFFTDFLGKEYSEISFKELEKNLQNDLKELVVALDELKDEIDANNHKLLEFNELAKEINYLEEEIKIKHNELYEVKQVIRKLKKDNN